MSNNNLTQNEHLEKRYDRYFINSKTESFQEHLKGLTTVELCVTELCTRTCDFCPRGNPEVYKNQNLHMSLDTVKKFADRCNDDLFTGDIHISGFGEPFLYKHIFDAVRILKTELPNNRICITNNGDRLTEEKLKGIFECGLDYMIISCYDGLESKQRFE
ncbi:MAG: radical SAM protein, partial [Proteobacteria bacterium]|nr:radical SAM protein [Pseudomonadota bacterium]